jgi:hypothetical protein
MPSLPSAGRVYVRALGARHPSGKRGPGVQPAAVMHIARPSQRSKIGSAIARSVRMMER